MTRRRLLAATGIVLVGLLLVWWFSATQPAMSSDAFQVVMATYSAANSKDPDRIEAIDATLGTLPLSDEEAEPIRDILRLAQHGDWESAADEAFELMQRQRR